MTTAPHIEVAQHALGVLGEWLGGYTDPDDDGHQARVVIMDGSVEEGFFDVEVIRSRVGWERSPRFRISVTVSPAPYPATLTAYRDDEVPQRGGGSLSSRDESGVVRPLPGAGYRSGSAG